MDKIVMKNMRFLSHSGVLEKEKEEGQEFVITLTLEVKDIPGCRTDDLFDTVNYAAVFELVRDYVEDVSCNLIEYMAEHIIRNVMSAFAQVEKITCEIRKPKAPIDGDFDYMGVIIKRDRKDMEEIL